MGTRATIEFSDERGDKYYVYRGHDSFPETVLEDINDVIEKTRGRWSEPEVDLLVTCFLGMMFDEKQRLPDYEITTSFHGDEIYRYFVKWDEESKKWKVYVE